MGHNLPLYDRAGQVTSERLCVTPVISGALDAGYVPELPIITFQTMGAIFNLQQMAAAAAAAAGRAAGERAAYGCDLRANPERGPEFGAAAK
jgi:hypothetical protein